MADETTVDAGGAGGIRLSSHPRARRDIAMAKGLGGLVTFGLATLLAHRAGMPLGAAVLRGVLAGMAGFVVTWMLAVAVWRHVALAQIENLRRDLLAAQAARMISQDKARGGDASGSAASAS